MKTDPNVLINEILLEQTMVSIGTNYNIYLIRGF